ncbi:MAG: hypothetical protein K1X88_09260 [Nannocystaceae bacterium]|nr:hypothetical protein [Nannocystaceae bacterium]
MSAAARTLLLLLAACRPATPATAQPAAAPSGALPPSRHAAGEQIDANVPLQAGGVLPLASLRGRVVIIEVVDAAHRDAAAEADYRALLEQLGDAVEVVLVSLDADGWHGDAPPVQLGWDPQGALAARLQAATLPTVIVLDAEGRVAFQYAGARERGHAEVLATARRLAG